MYFLCVNGGLTIQVAEAFLVALPKVVKVFRPIEAFLDDGPSTFCEGDKREVEFSGWQSRQTSGRLLLLRLTCSHFAEDVEGLRVLWLDCVNSAGSLTPYEQIVAILSET